MPVDGVYKIDMETPVGKQQARLTLKASGTKLTGSAEASIGKKDFTGEVKGDDLSWSIKFDSPMGSVILEFNGKVSGNDIVGKVKAGDFGSFTFKGKKI